MKEKVIDEIDFLKNISTYFDIAKDWKDLYHRQKSAWQKEREYSEVLAEFNSDLLANISKALEEQWDEDDTEGMRSVYFELKQNIVKSFEKFDAACKECDTTTNDSPIQRIKKKGED